MNNNDKVFIHRKREAGFLLLKGEELLYTFISKNKKEMIFAFYKSDSIEKNLMLYEEILS